METSFYWSDQSVGDGSLSPYDNDEYSDIWRVLFMRDRTTQGYIESYLNELAVTNPSSNDIQVDTGAALVDGKFYENDAADTTAISTPAVSTRINRVVLRKSWAAQTVRIAFLTGVEGAGVPSLTQADGVTWEIPLAQVQITTGAVITITDERTVCRTPLASAGTQDWTKIETVEGDGSSTDIDFSSIPTTYQHLMIVGQGRVAGAVTETDLDIKFNNDSSAVYNEQNLTGQNATAGAAAAASQTAGNIGVIPGASATVNFASQLELTIPNYKDTTFFKSLAGRYVMMRNNTVADFDVGLLGVLWRDASAINQITLVSGSGNFITGSKYTLYGLS